MKRLWQMLRALGKGIVSAFITDVAEANPEVAYAGVVEEMKERRESLLKAASEVLAEQRRKQTAHTNVSEELADARRQYEGAIAGNLTDVGPLLAQKVELLEQAEAKAKKELDFMTGKAEDVTRQLRRFDGEIRKLQDEARVKVAELRSAQARQRVADMLSGLSVDGGLQMLEGVRGAVDRQIARVEISEELRDTKLDRQLEQAKELGEAARGQDKFAAARRAYEAAHGVKAAEPAGGGDTGGGGKQA